MKICEHLPPRGGPDFASRSIVTGAAATGDSMCITLVALALLSSSSNFNISESYEMAVKMFSEGGSRSSSSLQIR